MNIDEIRTMLASYYDGTATGKDVDALKRYFVQSSDIPDELKVDAAVFRAMAAPWAGSSVPDGLEQRIIGSTIGKRPYRRFFYWRMAASVAASVAIVIALFFSFRKQPSETQDSKPLLASSILKTETVVDTPGIIDVNTEDAAQSVKEMTVATQKVKTANYREITDSVQVVEITSRLFAKLDATLNKAERCVVKTEIAVAVIQNPFRANKIKDELTNKL